VPRSPAAPWRLAGRRWGSGLGVRWGVVFEQVDDRHAEGVRDAPEAQHAGVAALLIRLMKLRGIPAASASS
jgi:hypothetical protein